MVWICLLAQSLNLLSAYVVPLFPASAYSLTLKMAAGSFETTNICQTTRHHITEDTILKTFFTSLPCSLSGLFHPPIQWEWRAVSPGVKRPEREIDHRSPSHAKIKNVWNCTSIHPYLIVLWCLGTRAASHTNSTG